MNTDKIEGKFKEVKGDLKKKYAELTDDDLKYGEGEFDKMLGKLQQKTGKTKEELREEIDKMKS